MKLFAFTFVLCSHLMALPPPVPGGGVIERQLEKEYEAEPIELENPLPPVYIDVPEEKLEMPDGVYAHIDCILIKGNVSIASEEIQSWIAPYLGKDLDLKDIYAVCAVINAGYSAKGFILARAYPPPQTIENGCLTIQIIEGSVGRIEVLNNRFYKTAFIESYFSKFLGCSLNYKSFMRSLLLLNENMDLSAGALLTKGEEPGTVNIVISVEDKRPWHLYLNGNNYGRDLTTNWRTGARFDIGSLFAFGDKFSLAEVVGFPLNALYFTDAVYSIPMNRNGLKLELSYLFSKFKVEQDRYLDLGGNSNIGTIKVSQAIIRSSTINFDVSGWFDVLQIENLEMGSIRSFDKLRVVRFSTLLDRFGSSRGRDYLNFRMSFGVPSILGGLPPVSSQCSRTGAGGRFVKFNVDYDRLQNLFKDMFLTFHFSGQWSPYRLAIPEQVYLGGADTVRGYPLAAALGDSGYYANLELHIPPPILANFRFFMAKAKWREVCQLVGFIDQGGVFLKGGSNVYETGVGIGLRLNPILGLSFSLDVGFPLVDNHLSSGAFTYMKVTACPF